MYGNNAGDSVKCVSADVQESKADKQSLCFHITGYGIWLLANIIFHLIRKVGLDFQQTLKSGAVNTTSCRPSHERLALCCINRHLVHLSFTINKKGCNRAFYIYKKPTFRAESVLSDYGALHGLLVQYRIFWWESSRWQSRGNRLSILGP